VTSSDPAPVRFIFGALLMAVALAGCASTPQGSLERDAAAKAFVTHPGHSAIYVYRPVPESNSDWDETVLYVNHRLIGTTLPQTYFRVDVEPGEHVLRGAGVDQGRFELKPRTRPDELYFVELRVTGGTSSYRLVDAETGKRAIRECCTLMENWAPGQRPLLR
jgi:hypothetical protein